VTVDCKLQLATVSSPGVSAFCKDTVSVIYSTSSAGQSSDQRTSTTHWTIKNVTFYFWL